MTRRRHAAVVAVLALGAVAGPPAAIGRVPAGEVLRAERAMDELRLDEARAVIAALEKTAPGDPETRFLSAELAFLEGDYARSAALLEKLDDPRPGGPASALRQLVADTLRATAGFIRRDSPGGHFVFSLAPGKDEALVDLAAEALEAAYREIGADLGVFPTSPVRVEILPRVADLAHVSTLTEKEIETSGTIALCKYGKLMVVSPRATVFGYPWLDTLAHEYTHLVVGLASSDRVPIWLHEGLAKYEETRWRAAAGAQRLGRTHEHLLAIALRRGRLVSFDEMHPSMAKLPSQEAASVAFAEVFTLVDLVHRQVGYEGIRSILQRIREGKSERRAIAEVVGRPFDDFEAGWRRHLRSLDLKPLPALSPSSLLRFERSRGDDENVGLELVAEERARKAARLGGLLRARGRLAAAAVEYEKARAHAPGDPFIGAKLARTYLELEKPAKAVEVAAPLAARDEDNAGLSATLGAAHLQLADHAAAEAYLSAAVRVQPFDPAVRCGLATVLAAAGAVEKAAREQAACRMLSGDR